MKKILIFLLFVFLGVSQVVAQNTSPDFDTIEPFNQRDVYVLENETINLFVDANHSDDDISVLEILINNKNLNNDSFLFYPNQTNTHPSQESTGISASYNLKNQSWNIDLGSNISSDIIDQGPTEITYVVNNSLNQTTLKSTTQKFYADSTPPQIEGIIPSNNQVFVNKNTSFTYIIDVFESFRKKNTLKSAVFRYDANNKTQSYNISINKTPINFPNLNITYNNSNQYLSFEFSKNKTRNFINNSAVFYTKLEDEAGNTYGSIENLSSEKTSDDFKYVNEYSLQLDDISPKIVDITVENISFLASDDLFKYSFQINETNLSKANFFITGFNSNYSFDLYPGQKDPLEYEGYTKDFVNASYNETSQIFMLIFDNKRTTDLIKKQNISIKIQAIDKAKNRDFFLENITLRIDNSAPQIDMIFPFKNNITLESQENFTLVVNAFDKTNNIHSLKIKYDYNKTTFIEEFTTNSSNYDFKTQNWKIEFNQSTTQKFIDEEFVNFSIEINDSVSNTFGSITKQYDNASKKYAISHLTNTTNKTNEIVSTQNTTIQFSSNFTLENIQNRSTAQIKVFEQIPLFTTTLENEVLIVAEINAVVPNIATVGYPLSKLSGYENLEFYVWNSTSWNLCPTNELASTNLICNTSSFSTWAITGVEVITPPNSGGGGGSNDDEEDLELFEFNINSMSFDETIQLQEEDKIELEFKGKTFNIEIENIDDEIVFNFQEIEFSLEQGDMRRFDLTNNNREDIEVQVEDIESSIAEIRLQRIMEEIEVVDEKKTQELESQEGEEEELGSQEGEEEEFIMSQIDDKWPRVSNLNENAQRNNKDNALRGYITQNIPTVAGALSGLVLITLIISGAYIMRRRL